ncbi:MAG: phenylacetate--CoA ligase, partial [Crenarchaeota archaeon]|nr:phenylacetate--CoA ligase [Thermoproteota archaeon]
EQACKNKQLDLTLLKRKIAGKLNNIIGLNPEIEILKCGELPRTEGKAKHVFDNRKGKT